MAELERRTCACVCVCVSKQYLSNYRGIGEPWGLAVKKVNVMGEGLRNRIRTSIDTNTYAVRLKRQQI